VVTRDLPKRDVAIPERDVPDMLTRGLRLLGQLAGQPDGQGVTKLAQDAGLPVSTAHRLLSVLAAERFVTFDPTSRQYGIGLRVLELAHNLTQTRSAYRLAREPMERLAYQTNLPVTAAVLEAGFAVQILSVEGQLHLEVRVSIGTRAHWYSSAVGKVLVAYADRSMQTLLLQQPMTPVTDRTITDRAVLESELVAVRSQGWAEVYGENEVGVHAIAVPVLHPDTGTTLCAMSLAATTVLTTRHELHGFIVALGETAKEIGLRLAAANTDFFPTSNFGPVEVPD
jgi:DNA-binding IclR family transcriptional regulator